MENNKEQYELIKPNKNLKVKEIRQENKWKRLYQE